MKGLLVMIRILIRRANKINQFKKERLIIMRKRIVTTLAVALFTISAASTALAHGHGHSGGHHGGYNYGYGYTVPDTTYTAPAPAVENTVPLVSAVCDVEGCMILGGHMHDDCNVVTHYYGDGHSYHNYYDHYYGDGHAYHHLGEWCH